MKDAPSPGSLRHLRPRNATGAAYLLLCTALTALGGSLAVWGAGRGGVAWAAWGVGQGVLGVALLQWFVLLHECGHRTLFRSAWANRVVGHLAGFFSTIPFTSWRSVHNLHHKWAGWQDLDPTTQSLVPRELKPMERRVMNLCWRLWIPAFTGIYRVSNFWNLPRLKGMGRKVGPVALEIVVLLALYGTLLWVLGPLKLLLWVGPGALLSLLLIEPIMMSQHTHVPQRLSEGEPVKPFPTAAQVPYTRSLVFPAWFSQGILLGFDAHELHHAYPAVPGYALSQIDWSPPRQVPWWHFVRAARAMRGEDFLFKNTSATGVEVGRSPNKHG